MANPPDMTKPLLFLGSAALAGWLFYEFVYKPSRTPQSGPPGTQPGPGPGNVASIGDSAKQGDTVLVKSARAQNLIPDKTLPPDDTEMVVTGASPGVSVILAQTTGNPAGVPAGRVVAVSRDSITTVISSSPIVPPSPSPLPAPAVDLGNPVPLQQGHHYRARLELGAGEALLANKGLVQQMLAGNGFTSPDLVVFGPGDPLPSDWPMSTVKPQAQNIYYAMGSWGQASGSIPRPSQVALIWEQ